MTSSTEKASGPISLRRKVLVAGFATAALILAGIAALILVSLNARAELRSATEGFIQEQRMADGITHSVMRQLASASSPPSGHTPELRREFQQAGDEVYVRIRQYLFENLSADERLLVEEMGEAHQRLEVAAARTADLATRGRTEEAQVSREAIVEHVTALLGAVDAFLELRETDLRALQDRQDATFQLIYVIGSLLAALVILGALVTAWVFHRRVSLPLAQLTRASERLASGDLEARVPTAKDREFQTLATGFNHMAESLQEATRSLEDRNEQLTSALQTLRDTQQELIQSEKLSAMGRMTAGMAHELNNPLATVLGYGQLLADRLGDDDLGAGEDLQREYLDPILQESERAQHLVRNFLHFSRRSETEVRPVSVRDALEVVVALREYAFQQAGLELVVEDLPDSWVQAEKQLLQGVFLNLVNNALDAMQPMGRGCLRITGRVEDRHLVVVFEDDGPGMDEPDRVFEPFFTTKAVGEGTGLGLALTHRFMKVFGGGIRAENRAEGGARLVLDFVLSEGPPDEAPAERRWEGAGIATMKEHPDTPWHVLVVEDEEPLRNLQERLLHRLNATVFLAEGVDRARRILREETVDAVVSDVKMPGENGLEFYRWLRTERPELARRFIFVTGDVSGPEIAALADESPELFIHKPFDVEEYLSRVSRILS